METITSNIEFESNYGKSNTVIVSYIDETVSYPNGTVLNFSFWTGDAEVLTMDEFEEVLNRIGFDVVFEF